MPTGYTQRECREQCKVEVVETMKLVNQQKRASFNKQKKREASREGILLEMPIGGMPIGKPFTC